MKIKHVRRREGESSLAYKYRQFRANGYRASHAMSGAKTLEEWAKLACGEHDEPDESHCVRLRVESDSDTYFDREMKDQGIKRDSRQWDEMARLWELSDGAKGIIVEWYDFEREEWIHADSCWGFWGYYDATCPIENSYVTDLMQSAIEAAQAQIGEGIGI
jgi:hypothetical protein